jgi:hypothetical protein
LTDIGPARKTQGVSTHLATIRRRATTRRKSPRTLVVSALGPLTALAGLAWALIQPYRIALLEPTEHGFWSLLVEPPLLVVLVGAVFHFIVAPSVLDDLEDANV